MLLFLEAADRVSIEFREFLELNVGAPGRCWGLGFSLVNVECERFRLAVGLAVQAVGALH